MPSPGPRRRSSRGFSLLELVVVVVVIAVLSVIAVPKLSSVLDRSTGERDRVSLAAVVRQAVALAAFDETFVDQTHLIAALADCEACTGTVSGVHAAGAWRLIGHDDGTGAAVDPNVPAEHAGSTDRSYTYGYVAGAGWGTADVAVVMATGTAGMWAHATVDAVTVVSWVDDDPAASADAPDGAVTDPPAATPAAPTGLTAAGNNTTIELTWDPYPAAGGYRVYRDGLEVAAPSTPTWSDPAVTAGIVYRYEVAAATAAGLSARSTPATGSIQPAHTVTLAFSGTPGDTAGLFHHLGTNLGVQAWAQPVGTRLLETNASTWLSAPHAGARGTTNRAGDYYHSAQEAGAWFMWDLQPGATFTPTHYTIQGRPHASLNPLNWDLQGSNDGATWTTLRAHVNDSSVGASTWGSWPVTTPGSWQKLRIRTTGLSSNDSRHYLTLGEVEFYGTYTRTDPAAHPDTDHRLTLTGYGDGQGLFGWVGTRGRTQPYGNPAELGLVEATSSSELNWAGSARFATATTADYYHSALGAGAWVRWDLGPDVRFRPTHYTLKARNSADLLPRSWVLEGANDDTSWTVLRTHAGDTGLLANSWAGWSVNPGGFYRYLRIRSTDTTWCANSCNPNYLVFHRAEFYGDLDEIEPASPVPGATRFERTTVLGDDTGIFAHLGTQAGGGTWTNPALAAAVTVTHSTSLSDQWGTGAGGPAATNRAGGYFHSALGEGSWIAWDFVDHRVSPRMYTMRGRSAADLHLRSWVLEGSNVGVPGSGDWTVLRTHSNDRALWTSQWAGWHVEGASAYRHLRIRMTGPANDNRHYLTVDEVEFYGDLSTVPGPTLPGAQSFAVRVDGTGGIVDHLGTLSGSWVHPVTAGALAVGQSTRLHATAGAEYTVDRSGNYYHSLEATNQWVQWDFGSRSVQPLGYTIRGRGTSGLHLRHWTFAGSNDGVTWTPLHHGASDPRVNTGTTGFWHVAATGQAWRYLRVTQTGPSSDGRHYLTLDDIELYGHLAG